MSKFQIGDEIQVKNNGNRAVITKVDTTVAVYMYPVTEYGVVWHDIPGKGECLYMAHDVDDLWEKVAAIPNAHVLSGPGRNYINQDPDLLPHGEANFDYESPKQIKSCDHKWVEVGFIHTKTVCYHCDTEKP